MQIVFLSLFINKPTLSLITCPNMLLFLDDYHKIMDQETWFDVKLLIFDRGSQKSQLFSEAQCFADNNSSYALIKPAAYFSNFESLGDLRFDALYSFNQYPMQNSQSVYSLKGWKLIVSVNKITVINFGWRVNQAVSWLQKHLGMGLT